MAAAAAMFPADAAALVDDHPRLADLPEPVLDADPDWVELYRFAWRLAARHVSRQAGLPQSPYIDEAFDPKTIWIWDTCFMVHFCRYAAGAFPGVESLRNFYAPILDGTKIPLRIEIPDNPPLFAWTELEHYRVTGDKARIAWLLHETRYLQRHFEWFDRCVPGIVIANSAPTFLQKVENGYHWEGGRSGMDNTPRGRTGAHATRTRPNNPHMLWIDAIAQQALSSLSIARLADEIGDTALASRWRGVHRTLSAQINRHYWDDADGFYYDLDERDLSPIKVVTPASFWPLLAEVASPRQAARMVEVAADPQRLGGAVPWVSLARNDGDFNPTGGYWRGSMWLPTGYMGIKAIQKYGYLDLAHQQASAMIAHMAKTYAAFEPHTIWECYNPIEPKPAINELKPPGYARPDFCGWSALGPISLLIENVLGFYDIDARKRVVRWHKTRRDRHGIRNLRFGDVRTSIIADRDRIEVDSNRPYVLEVGGRRIKVAARRGQVFAAPVRDG